jgi:hypothetical protein
MAVAPDRDCVAFTACNAVDNASAAPYKLLLCDTLGREFYSWDFKNLRDWSSAQPLFLASDSLAVYTQDGATFRWKLVDGRWTEAKETTSPTGWFFASTASPDGRTIYLATGAVMLRTAPDGTKYDGYAPPYDVLAVAADTGKLLWKQTLQIGSKYSQQNFTAEPINALVAVPGTTKVAAALWDGRIAVIDPPAESPAVKKP